VAVHIARKTGDPVGGTDLARSPSTAALSPDRSSPTYTRLPTSPTVGYHVA
jgi:hypothetical protein